MQREREEWQARLDAARLREREELQARMAVERALAAATGADAVAGRVAAAATPKRGAPEAGMKTCSIQTTLQLRQSPPESTAPSSRWRMEIFRRRPRLSRQSISPAVPSERAKVPVPSSRRRRRPMDASASANATGASAVVGLDAYAPASAMVVLGAVRVITESRNRDVAVWISRNPPCSLAWRT